MPPQTDKKKARIFTQHWMRMTNRQRREEIAKIRRMYTIDLKVPVWHAS